MLSIIRLSGWPHAGAALAVLLAGWPPHAAVAAPAAAPAVTTRAEFSGAGAVLRTRLLQRADWGRGVVVVTAGDAADLPLAVELGLAAQGALAGPVAVTGAWRELADPLGHDAGSAVFAEATRLRLKSGLYPGSLRGVQLTPVPELTLLGWRRLAAAGAGVGAEPPTFGLVASLPPDAALRMEAYAALRADAPHQPRSGWKLATAPFPGGALSLAGARVALAVAGVDLWASANLSGGPRVPLGGHARLAARGGLEFGELRAMVAVAGREFRGLTGASSAAPLAWALQFRGAAGPGRWKLKYRLAARGEELAPVLRPPGGADSAARKLSVAVTPVVPLGVWTVSGTGKLEAAAGGVVRSAGARLYGRPGELEVTWREGRRGGGSVRVRGAVAAAPVTAEAGVTAAGGSAAADLGIRLRTPKFSLHAAVRKLGKAPPAGPAVTVTFTTPP